MIPIVWPWKLSSGPFRFSERPQQAERLFWRVGSTSVLTSGTSDLYFTVNSQPGGKAPARMSIALMDRWGQLELRMKRETAARPFPVSMDVARVHGCQLAAHRHSPNMQLPTATPERCDTSCIQVKFSKQQRLKKIESGAAAQPRRVKVHPILRPAFPIMSLPLTRRRPVMPS